MKQETSRSKQEIEKIGEEMRQNLIKNGYKIDFNNEREVLNLVNDIIIEYHTTPKGRR